MTTLIIVDRDENEIHRVDYALDGGPPKRLEISREECLHPDLPTITVVDEVKFRVWRRDHLQHGGDELVYELVDTTLA